MYPTVPKTLNFIFFCLILIKTRCNQIFVTPNRTCGTTCIGDLSSPYDNLLFAIQNVSLFNPSPATIILLGNSSTEHYLLPREQDQLDSTSMLYDFTDSISFLLYDFEIRPLFCDELLVKANPGLSDKCVNRDEKLTIVFKPMQLTLIIYHRLLVQNIIFDWTESSKSVNITDECAQNRRRCCRTTSSTGEIDCDPKFYHKDIVFANHPYSFIRLDTTLSLGNSNRSLLFDFVVLKNFRDKTMKTFIQTSSIQPFELVFQNSIIEDVTFGQGLIGHIGTGLEQYNSSIKINNVNFTKYNYWNRDPAPDYYFWNEGYLFFAENNFKGYLSIVKSNFIDMNAASMYYCDREDGYSGSDFKNNNKIKTDIWSRYHERVSIPESSVIYIKQFDGDMTIEDSTFQMIIGVFGSVIQVSNCTAFSRFTFINSKFDDNFGMQGFANILIVAKSIGKVSNHPIIDIQNCEFINSKGCPGSYGNVGLITYWAFQPTNDWQILNGDHYLVVDASLFDPQLQINISNSTFRNNLIPLSNSLAIVGSVFTVLNDNKFQDNGGTTADIILYSLRNSNFQAKKPYLDSSSYSLNYFGQSTVLFFDRILRFRSSRNTFQRNWGPWQGSQALATTVTIRYWMMLIPDSIIFKDDVFQDNWGIPPHIAQDLSYGVDLKNNSYTPPLVTLSYSLVLSVRLFHSPFILFDGVEFSNNTLSFDLNQGCRFNFLQIYTVCTIMSNKRRYLTGLIKFTSESEVREQTNTDFVVIDPLLSLFNSMDFSMKNVKIINNTLFTEGCFFSTLWTVSYSLDSLKIFYNKIYPTAAYFTESSEYSEPLLGSALNNRNGVFCAFQKESLKLGLIRFAANKLDVRNNVGTILNLYPQENSFISLTNSLFVKNSCPYGAMVNIFEASIMYLINNLFIRNDNSLGIFFITSAGALSHGIYNTYILNNGKHASLSYINDLAKSTEILSNNYWNTINPKFQTFRDNVTPQGGLYYVDSADINFLVANFKQNYPYAGFLISIKSTASFVFTTVIDHNITGNSIIGNFYSSILNIREMDMRNNTLMTLPSSSTKPSMISLSMSKLNVTNVKISETSRLNQGSLLIGSNVEGTLENINFDGFYMNNGNAIIKFDFSIITARNFVCDKITSFFKLSESSLAIISISVQNLITYSSSKFLFNIIDTTLNISQLNYIGSSYYEDYYSLITGSNNKINMIDTYFLNAVKGKSKIIELTNSVSVFIARSEFYYTDNYTETLVFDLTSSNEVKIVECVFFMAGKVIKMDKIFNGFFFVDNTILTNSYFGNFQLVGTNITYFVNNYILREGGNIIGNIPDFQIYLENSAGLTTVQHNCFISLVGSKGIFKIFASTEAYNIISSNNTFIDNKGVRGGAFYIDASLVFESLQLPLISIEDSLFILNKAVNYQDVKGKGGAIYQTTSTLTKQATNIRKSLFLNNSAEVIGGAIFFDHLPPKIDVNSKFVENFASRLNHVASYPIKLAYYKSEIPEKDPYLPSQPFIEQSDSQAQDGYKWENIPSGILVEESYIFGLVDMFDQIVYDDNSSVLELYPEGIAKEKRNFFSSKLSVEAKNGVFNFSNFEFSHRVNEYINVTFNSSAIKDQRVIPLDNPIILSASLKIQIHFRNCQIGEYIVTKYNSMVCEKCQPNFWQTSPKPNMPTCEPCDKLSTICLGGNDVGPRKGYSRLNENSNIVLECPRASSCLGNEYDKKTSLDPVGSCQYGHTGNLCSNCIPGWAKTSSGLCTNCKTDVWFYLKTVATFAFQLALIVQGFRGTRALCRQYAENKLTDLNGAILIRILTNYIQLISLVSKIPIIWPTLFKNLSSITSEVASVNESVFTIDCIFGSGKVFGIKLVFVKLLTEIIGGFLLVFFGIIFWIIYYIIKKKAILKNINFTNDLITTAIVICFMMQPSAIQAAFSFFQCTNLYREDEPIYYFSKDYEVKCWEGGHLYWALGLGVPSLMIWSCILPFIVFNEIRKNKDELTTEQVAQKYAFLYGGYMKSRYYWELVIMARKFLFIGVVISASLHSINLQVYVSVIFIMMFYFIHMIGKPFSDPKMNHLERLSLLSASTTNFCGLYFQLVSDTPQALDFIVIIIGFFANMIFLVSFAKLYFFIQIQKIKENKTVYPILMKVINKLWCLNKSKKVPAKKRTDYLKNPEQEAFNQNTAEILRASIDPQALSPSESPKEGKLITFKPEPSFNSKFEKSISVISLNDIISCQKDEENEVINLTVDSTRKSNIQ